MRSEGWIFFQNILVILKYKTFNAKNLYRYVFHAGIYRRSFLQIKSTCILVLIFLLSFNVTFALSKDSSETELIQKIKHLSKEGIAQFLCDYSEKEILINDILMFYSLLDNKEFITENSHATNLQIRDVAIAGLEAITGEFFLPQVENQTFPVKEIISYRAKDNDIFCRFSITLFTDNDFQEIKLKVKDWIDRFKKRNEVGR